MLQLLLIEKFALIFVGKLIDYKIKSTRPFLWPLLWDKYVKETEDPMINVKSAIIISLTILAISAKPVMATNTLEFESQQMFFDRLSALCGTRYEGQSVFPEDPGDAFRDQLLVAVFETCGADEIGDGRFLGTQEVPVLSNERRSFRAVRNRPLEGEGPSDPRRRVPDPRDQPHSGISLRGEG